MSILRIKKQIDRCLDIDILSKSRKKEYVIGRMFLYYYIHKLLNVNKNKVYEFLEFELSYKTDRTNVLHALSIAELDLSSNLKIRPLVKAYFPELVKEGYNIIYNETTKTGLVYNEKQKQIIKLTKGMNKWQITEIENMIRMRKSSWKWKNQDKCEIIEGYERLNTF